MCLYRSTSSPFPSSLPCSSSNVAVFDGVDNSISIDIYIYIYMCVCVCVCVFVPISVGDSINLLVAVYDLQRLRRGDEEMRDPNETMYR